MKLINKSAYVEFDFQVENEFYSCKKITPFNFEINSLQDFQDIETVKLINLNDKVGAICYTKTFGEITIYLNLNGDELLKVNDGKKVYKSSRFLKKYNDIAQFVSGALCSNLIEFDGWIN